MKKILTIVVAALLFSGTATAVFAQSADHSVFGVSTAVTYSYDVSAQSLGYGFSAGLDFTLSDRLTAGFLFLQGAGSLSANAQLFSLDYALTDKLGFGIKLGTDGGPLTGIGMSYDLLKRKTADALSSILKAKVDYLFDPSTGVDTGDLCVTLALSTGI